MFHIFALTMALFAHAGEFPEIEIMRGQVPPDNALAQPNGNAVRIYGEGDSIFELERTGILPDGRGYRYKMTGEVFSGRGGAPTNSAPSSASPKQTDSPSTTSKIANGAGVTIVVYQVFDQSTRTADQLNGEAKRLRDMLEHGFKSARMSAAEQIAFAEKMNRQTAKNFSRSLTNAAIASSRVKMPSAAARPEELRHPKESCRAGGVGEDFARTKRRADAARLAQYVDAALDTESSECRDLVPEVTNGDYVLDTARISPNAPASPLNPVAFAVPAGTVIGRQLRGLANDYQSNWIKKSGYRNDPEQRDFFTSGATLLGAADDAYTRGEFYEGQALQNASRITLDILRGATDGALESIEELYHAVPIVAGALKDVAVKGLTDPVGLAQASQKMVAGIPSVAKKLWTSAIAKYDSLKNGSAYDRAKFLGKEITAFYTPALAGRVLRATGAGVEIVTAGARAGMVEREMSNTLARYSDHIRGQWMGAVIDESKVAGLATQLHAAETVIQQGGQTVTEHARNFMASRLANGAVANVEVATEHVVRAGRQYMDLATRMAEVSATGFDDSVTRGIPKAFHLNVPGVPAPVIFEATAKNVADHTFHSFMAVNRMSGMGETGWYATIGAGAEVEGLIAKETGKAVEDLVFGTQKVTMKSALDLTDPSVLAKLNINTKLLQDANYELTHVIEHIARKQMMEGIIYSDAPSGLLKNIVVF